MLKSWICKWIWVFCLRSDFNVCIYDGADLYTDSNVFDGSQFSE